MGALQGSSKGPQMTKIAENGQKNEGFVVVSSQMLLGRKRLCKDTVIWCRGTKEKVRGPSGTIYTQTEIIGSGPCEPSLTS